ATWGLSMIRYLAAASVLALAGFAAATPAAAQSSYTETCSNVWFVYDGVLPAIEGMCLTPSGRPNQTKLILNGINNVGGKLVNTHTSQPSNFQASCGSITLLYQGPIVTLSAYCRVSGNSFNQTSVSLDNINNNNGILVQGK